ncbi:MAG TPA: phosphoenolpyruvate--protein phosphotransferase [Candidatus Marinimicrobia bacterium]|nr:phosphoenolpyruvate--protein phosphotransferase [Candidatus Neomarinimicrobiota bacterium]
MKILKGIRISPGVAIGSAYYVETGKVAIPHTYIDQSEVEAELEKFHRATQRATEELNQVRDMVMKHLDEEHARLIDAQIMTLADVDLVQKMTDMVRQEHRNVIWAYDAAMEWYENALLKTMNQFQQERLIDLQDIKKRMFRHLSTEEQLDLPQIPERVIYVGERISPSELIQLHNQKILGIITRIGGMDSHSGILARAFGIPYLSNVNEIDLIGKSHQVILDADREIVIVDAKPSVLKKYAVKLRELEIRRQRLNETIPQAITRDGIKIEILLNAGFLSEVKNINLSLIDGIGLFRTEYLCLERDDLPNEEEQFRAYRQITMAMQGKPTTFRTFDFGREKMMAILNMEMFQKDAVFDTWGGIRFCLDNPRILITQLRALLRASQFGPLKIMFPLVSNSDEILQVLEIYRQVQSDLEKEGHAFNRNIPLGAMVETKSILDELEKLTELLNFFSVGTNDLALFLLGLKRADTVSKNYYHPKIFQAINQIINVAQKNNFPVTVCGEMASDPYAILGLLALEVRSFSMSVSSLIDINDLIRMVNIQKISSLKKNLLTADSVQQVYKLLRSSYKRITKNKM